MKLIKTIFFNSLFFLCLLAGGGVHANDLPISQSEFLSPDEAFVMSHEVVNEKHIKINWKIHPGYYLYMGMFEFESLDKDNLIQKVEMPDGEKKTDEFFGEVDIYYFSTSADVYLENNFSEYLDLKIKYQGCADAGLCYPPIFKTITVKKKLTTSSLQKTSIFES